MSVKGIRGKKKQFEGWTQWKVLTIVPAITGTCWDLSRIQARMNEEVPPRYPMAAHKVLPSAWVLQAAFCQPCTGSQGSYLAYINRNFPFGFNYFLTEIIMLDSQTSSPTGSRSLDSSGYRSDEFSTYLRFKIMWLQGQVKTFVWTCFCYLIAFIKSNNAFSGSCIFLILAFSTQLTQITLCAVLREELEMCGFVSCLHLCSQSHSFWCLPHFTVLGNKPLRKEAPFS